MSVSDAFAAEIIKMVRNMPDQAILDLVRDRLAVSDESAPAPKRRGRSAARAARTESPKAKAAASKAAASKAAPKAKRKTKGRRKRRTGAGKEQLLSQVESIVKKSKGLALREIASKVGESKSVVAAALRELKANKRIYQGGDRRFARYAGTAGAANAASKRAQTGG